MPSKLIPSPPGADPLDLLPNRVNRALLGPDGDPNLFPIEASWIDLLHDKGHLSRASIPWMSRFLQRRLLAGDDPVEIACRIWLWVDVPINGASAFFMELLRLDDRAADACLEPLGTVAIFERLGAEFAAASAEWNPPQDLEFRGWSASRTDRKIRDDSRERFAALAQTCQRAAEAGGLCSALRQSALGHERHGRPRLHDPFFEKASQARNCALIFALATASRRPGVESWISRERAALAGACCLNFSPKGFRKALALIAPQEEQYARLGGEACAWAWAADDDGVLKNPQIPGARFLTQLAATGNAAFGRVAPRADDALSHFSSWIDGGLGPHAGSFFEGLLGAPVERADGAVLERFLSCAEAPRESMTAAALAWASARAALKLPVALSEPAVHLLWLGHLGPAKQSASRFASRHLAMSRFFPNPQLEAQSLALAPAPVLAQIEAVEMDRCVRAFVHSPEISGAPMEAGGLDDADSAPAPPPRRMRL